MKTLDPNMATFLLDHPMARAGVYNMMRNAATTRDDPKMVAWYAPVQKVVDETPGGYRKADVEAEEFRKLIRESGSR